MKRITLTFFSLHSFGSMDCQQVARRHRRVNRKPRSFDPGTCTTEPRPGPAARYRPVSIKSCHVLYRAHNFAQAQKQTARAVWKIAKARLHRKSTLGLRMARRSQRGKCFASRSGGETNFLHLGQTTVGCPMSLSFLALVRCFSMRIRIALPFKRACSCAVTVR
jgi:hypothetical protein